MATATIQQVKAGLKANLDLVFTDPWTVTDFVMTSPNPPSIDIAPAHPVSIEFDTAMAGGGHCLYFIVRGIAASAADTDWQVVIDGLADPASTTSIKKAIETDKTLGGIVSWAVVRKASGYHSYKQDGSLYPVMGMEFTVEVQT